MDTFDRFDHGRLITPYCEKDLGSLCWNDHPAFEGVALKHLLAARDTDGMYSYHLVRIAPGKKIGDHIHADQLETHEVIAGSGKCINEGMQIDYTCGVISVMKKGTHHEVLAGDDGLYLFAKFIPALC